MSHVMVVFFFFNSSKKFPNFAVFCEAVSLRPYSIFAQVVFITTKFVYLCTFERFYENLCGFFETRPDHTTQFLVHSAHATDRRSVNIFKPKNI